jgi:hypothetical protein
MKTRLLSVGCLVGLFACEGLILPSEPTHSHSPDASTSGGTAMMNTGGAGGGFVDVDAGNENDAGHTTDLDAGIPDAGITLDNAFVFAKLTPTCAGCHRLGDISFFSSLAAFENRIVYNPRWIALGNPDASALLKLLDGTVSPQMPPAPSVAFSTLAAQGNTAISMNELRQWISSLQPNSNVVDTNFVNVRRKSPEQVIESLKTQLGLVDADLYVEFRHSPPYEHMAGSIPFLFPANGDGYALASSDGFFAKDESAFGGFGLFLSMGGPYYLENIPRNNDMSSSFLMTLTHVSQAQCRTAVAKTPNPIFFTAASLTDTTTNAAGLVKIRQNISDLYLRMLGEPASAAELDDLVNTVFKAYESKGASTAWTAVCAALVRDPLWILY